MTGQSPTPTPTALEVPHRGERQGRLWFGLLGGALMWLAHLLAAYGIAEFGCVAQVDQQTWLGISVLSWAVIAVTVVTELIALAAIGAAWSAASQLEGASHSGDDEPVQQSRSQTGHIGVITSALFAAAIVFESIPILYYLHSC